MSVSFYFDEHIRSAIADALRERGVDVLTIQQDGREGLDDAHVLDRATELGRAVFTNDDDFLREASMRQRSGRHFAGVV